MKVAAKCTLPAWDSKACVMLEPGKGPLPGGLYEIERDGDLANMKAFGRNVFEFDRAVPGSGHDYTCKECGEKCKSLNELGTHKRSRHPFQPIVSDEPIEDGPILLEKRGRAKKTEFHCKTCNEVFPNLYAIRVHNKTHEKTA